MMFSTYRADGRMFYGARSDRGMIALSPDMPQWQSLRDVCAADGWSQLEDAAAGKTVTHEDGSYTFEMPVPNAEKIICVGVNYPDRNSEYQDGVDAPPYPSLFMRTARSFVGHETAILRPPESEQFDYEGEVVIVIGKAGRRISETNALDHIAALSLCNEGSVRDWLRHAKFNVTQGKNFDNSGSIGPGLVPYRDEAQIADIALTTHVNGELRQTDRTSRMMYDFRFIIRYISTFTTLVPGDVIVTGTPTGAGARLKPPVWLVPGDVVEVAADGIGTLRNVVADEVVA